MNNTVRPAKTGILILNLGTPDQPTKKAVSKYLSEFLSDKRVVELPSLLWKPLLNLMVIPLRAKRVAHSYSTIWMGMGSPLLVYTKLFIEGLQAHFNHPGLVFDYAMRYGNPSLSGALDRMRERGCERVLICPMYPQYSAATTATTFDAAAQYNKSLRNQLELLMPKRYAAAPQYIGSLERSVRRYWKEYGKPELLLLSFHGMPQASIDKGDPYQQDCFDTAEALKQRLADTGVRIEISFQSQFGKAKWIGPATTTVLTELAKQQLSRIDVLCPGFSVDCLETLEEIAISEKENYQDAGGGDYHYIPCLNNSDYWIEAFADWLRQEYPAVFSKEPLEKNHDCLMYR